MWLIKLRLITHLILSGLVAFVELVKLYRPLAVLVMVLSMLLINYWLIEVWRWQNLQAGEQLLKKWLAIQEIQPNSQLVNQYVDELKQALEK